LIRVIGRERSGFALSIAAGDGVRGLGALARHEL
jgi:hypothetical protein